jgi:hypothetical protein
MMNPPPVKKHRSNSGRGGGSCGGGRGRGEGRGPGAMNHGSWFKASMLNDPWIRQVEQMCNAGVLDSAQVIDHNQV